jgi:tRNA(fMet)-specific endonuclease VapC
MLRFLLDTDHLTLYQRGHPPLGRRLALQPPDTVGVSVVTVEEALRGRLARVARAADGPARLLHYALLLETVQLFHQFAMVLFNQPVENQFQHLLSLRLRVGTQDLKIAAIALANHLTVLTRNRRDFGRVPGLALDDWSV